MNLSDKLQQISQRVESLLADLDKMGDENRNLKEENQRLRSDYTKLEKDISELRLQHSDQSSAVKAKLETVLHRLDELDSLDM